VKLPPVWWYKCTTPVKAKTNAPAPNLPTSCAALTWRGLVSATHTGSRERGGGLRQTLERQDLQRDRHTVGRKDVTGTVWATPLAHTIPALARDLAAPRSAKEAPWASAVWLQATCWRGACARLAASKVAV
jgi:hypothetical protein